MKLIDGLVLSKADRTWVYKSSVLISLPSDVPCRCLAAGALRKPLLHVVMVTT